MNVIYMFLLFITIVSFSFLVPAALAVKSLSKKTGGQLDVSDSSVNLVASSKLRVRFRIFLCIGIIDLIVLFITR